MAHDRPAPIKVISITLSEHAARDFPAVVPGFYPFASAAQIAAWLLPLLAALPISLDPAKSILQPRNLRFLFFGSQRRRTKRCSDTRQLRTNEFRLTAAVYNYHSLLSASFFRGPFLDRAFLRRQLRQGFIAFKPALKNPQLSESGIFTRSAVSSIFSAIILIIQKTLFTCTAAAAMIAFPAHVSVSGTASAVAAEQHHQNDDNAQSNKNPGQNS